MANYLEKYEELCIRRDTSVRCSRGDLYRTLCRQKKQIGNQDLYLRRDGESWELLYETGEGENVYGLHVWPAVKIRVEAEISRLDDTISRQIEELKRFYHIKEVCCDVKNMDILEDFLIADVYFEYEDS